MNNSMIEQIDAILQERHKRLPEAEALYEKIEENKSKVDSLISGIDGLLVFKKLLDEENVSEAQAIRSELSGLRRDCADACDQISNLRKRFSRKTVNIGVSGEARVGKSTTLQSFSGLTDDQIPTGTGLPVTAVRSEIFNSEDSYASIVFRDTEEYIAQYIAPHVANVNSTGACNLAINSISDLRAAQLPAALGDNIGSAATASLICLQQAQDSLDTYVQLLTGETKRIGLDEIRRYVAYPSDAELNSGNCVDRAYLAVKSVEIFSPFPALSNEKIGLIDLPGLGEIGKEAANIHTSGLENNVDQILLIMYPHQAEGYLKAGIADNVDQLRSIQPGVSRRSDLIIAAINNDDSNIESSRTLRNDFESRINAPQKTDKIEIRDYVAVDESSVRDLFDYLLRKLVRALPSMDKDVFDYVAQKSISTIDDRINSLSESLSGLVAKISSTIPLEDSLLDKLTDSLSRNLVYDYDELEQEMYAAIGKADKLRKDLEDRVTKIYKDNEFQIQNGLFLGNENKWQDHARGRADYISFLRSEAQRIKAEIADSYRGVDVFYDEAIDQLKVRAFTTFCNNMGTLSEHLNIDSGESIDARINRLVNALDTVTHNANFTQCFRFITEVKFKFSQNVFYNIYSSLEVLNNPDVNQKLGERGLAGSERIALSRRDLKDMASKGNQQIKDQILAHNDQFNQFLFTCMTFFNDFLYRKDVRGFERCIRLLLKEYREYIAPDESPTIDPEFKKAIKTLSAFTPGPSTAKAEKKQQMQKSVSENFEKPVINGLIEREICNESSEIRDLSIAGPDSVEGMSGGCSLNSSNQAMNLSPGHSSKNSRRYNGSFDQNW